MISYVFIKFSNKLNVNIFLITLPKNGMVKNGIKWTGPESVERQTEKLRL